MVTTIQECELYAAFATWINASNEIADYRMLVNFPAFGYDNIVDKIEWRTQPQVLPTEQNIIDSYNQYLLNLVNEQQIEEIEQNSKQQASAIPSWSSWTESEALNWHDTNITNVLPVANLTEANTVLQKLEVENRALIRMVLALRNKVFPSLEGS